MARTSQKKQLQSLERELESHPGEWVAIAGLAVVGAGKTPKAALRQAEKSGRTGGAKPFLHRVRKNDVPMVLAL